ncbi:MAG TPA: amidohydrolase [Candidatus Woesearchaeota archaeon]|nr:amidohydrolase [Candidatus Woesearchaeota archaeon]
MILKNCRFVITQDSSRKILENVDLHIEDGKIKSISKPGKKKPGDYIDCSDKIILPGLTNAHTHIAMTLFRGFEDGLELNDWLGKINPIEEKLTPKLISLSAELGIMEMLSKGVASFVDMCYPFKETYLVSGKYGIRSVLGPGFSDKSFKEAITFAKSLLKLKSAFFRPSLSHQSIYTCSEKTLLMARDFARKHNIKLNIHAAETRKEVLECYKKNRMFVIEYLDSLGLLDNSILAHCGWITKGEARIIAEKSAVVVHNPVSNMKLATGAFFPYTELSLQNVPIALGTDSAASNNSLGMFDEMKAMCLLNKNNSWDASLAKAQDALDSATIHGASATGFANGSIELGKEADLAAISAKSLELMPLRKDSLLGNLVYSFNSYVDFTMIAGKIVFDKAMLPEWLKRADKISRELNQFIEKNR